MKFNHWQNLNHRQAQDLSLTASLVAAWIGWSHNHRDCFKLLFAGFEPGFPCLELWILSLSYHDSSTVTSSTRAKGKAASSFCPFNDFPQCSSREPHPLRLGSEGSSWHWRAVGRCGDIVQVPSHAAASES